MSKISFVYSFVILLSFIFCAQSQVLRRRDDDDQQQVHKKVERINLRDFGFDSKTDRFINTDSREIQKEDDQKVKQVETSFRDFNSSPRRLSSSSRRDHTSSRSYETSRGSFDRPSSRGSFSERSRDCSNCVESKYLQHYYSRGCQPVIDSVCNCPKSFDCPSYTASTNSSVCHYDGRSYRIGSRIPVRNPCRICECRDFGRRNDELNAEIDCGIGIECPEEAFGVKPQPNCYFSYERGKCCGRHECPNKEDKRAPKVCKYKGREYKLGQKIYPDEDVCKTCHCTEDWNDENPLSSNACQIYKCEFELNKDFKSGCLPIYHEGTCCPIEYKCPKSYGLISETFSSTQCVFEGRKYPIGSKLDIGEKVCVDCTCKVPPDFTCVHKSCPSPQPNCYVGKWDNTVCCQKYICSRPQEIRDESQFRDSFYTRRNN